MTFSGAALVALEYHLHAHLGPDLLRGSYRAHWSPENRTAGLCSVASEAAWFVLGGSPAGWVPQVASDGPAGTHWWLAHRPSGTVFDPTRAQYDQVGSCPPYERGAVARGTGFMGVRRDPENPWGLGLKPSLRAQQLLERLLPEATPERVAAFRATLLNPAPRPRRRGP